MSWNTKDSACFFSVVRYSHCSVPIDSTIPTSHLPWIHSSYRDSLAIHFDSSVSNYDKVNIMWRSQVLETVDLPTKSKNPADSPVVIIASTPRIAIKTTAVDTEKRLTSRRIQIRLEDERAYTLCLAEFEKRNCIIKKVIGPANSISNSQMLSNSQPEFPSSQHIPSQSATQQTFSPMINRASIQKAQTAFSPIAPASVPQGTEIFEFQPAQSGIQNNIPSSAVENSLPSMQLGDLNDIEISNYICDCLCDPKFVKLCDQVDRVWATLDANYRA
ncbi:uncharacterized protein V2V93DRAFT_403343 [Kockiozyma suomiensis]|uniref:uncharacterized protein n=1 Tax=Kockiozyma suomiensis TaxID=1337062 RepID=UPI00334370DC